MRKLMAFMISAGLCLMLPALPAYAMEVSLGPSVLHLPSSSYHYLSLAGHLAFGSESKLKLTLGMTPGFKIGGFSQVIYYGDVSGEWSGEKDSFLRPFFGLGAGVYVDRVNSSSGVTPSLVMRSGARFGGEHLGVILGTNVYVGIYEIGQLFQFTAWPMTTFTGALYVAF